MAFFNIIGLLAGIFLGFFIARIYYSQAMNLLIWRQTLIKRTISMILAFWWRKRITEKGAKKMIEQFHEIEAVVDGKRDPDDQ